MQATPRHLVERFYHEVWNRADEGAAQTILHPDVTFRGSLGPERRGVGGFVAYMQGVHAALGGYTCRIDHLVTEGPDAAARMSFGGTHRGPFFGIPATGRQITWAGAAFFHTEDGLIRSIWVLGDIDAVKAQLGADPGAAFA